MQFAVLAFFFSSIVPFAGAILLPTVWLMDKKVLFWFISFQMVIATPYIPGIAESFYGTFIDDARLHHVVITSNLLSILHTFSYVWSAVTVFVAIPFAFVKAAFFGSLAIRRKLKKRAPDLWNMIKK